MGFVPPFSVAVHYRPSGSDLATFVDLDSASVFAASKSGDNSVQLVTVRDGRGRLVEGVKPISDS